MVENEEMLQTKLEERRSQKKRASVELALFEYSLVKKYILQDRTANMIKSSTSFSNQEKKPTKRINKSKTTSKETVNRSQVVYKICQRKTRSILKLLFCYRNSDIDLYFKTLVGH